MKTFNVTLSNNTSLQVIANSVEEVLEAFKMEVTGIVCDNAEQCTPLNTRMEWINFNHINRFEILFNFEVGCFVVRCNKGNFYGLSRFLEQMNYSVKEVNEILLLHEKITSISKLVLVVKTYKENYLTIKVKDVTLLDSCLLRLMKELLKALE